MYVYLRISNVKPQQPNGSLLQQKERKKVYKKFKWECWNAYSNLLIRIAYTCNVQYLLCCGLDIKSIDAGSSNDIYK